MKSILLSVKPECVKKIFNGKKTVEISTNIPKLKYILIPISTWQETLYAALGREVGEKK